MTANPKKAAILGLLGVVALYFWAPLMSSWFSTDAKLSVGMVSGKPPVPVLGSAAPETSSVAVPALVNTAKGTPYSWQQLSAWMESDPRTKPADPLKVACDPFQTSKFFETLVHKIDLKPIEQEISPRAANLVLSSTIVGSSSPVARINGKNYRLQESIQIRTKDGRRLAFILTEIQARSVVLERLGKQYELQMQTPKSGTIEMVGSIP